MTHLRLLMPLTAATLLVLCCLNGRAQNAAITISVNQPEIPLTVEAGADQLYDGNASIVLGGEPTAMGGFGEYTYQWQPAEYLDDATIANPTIIKLDGPTTFTLTVSDPGALCSKVAQVLVDFALALPELQLQDVRMYPNPFMDAVTLESTAPISEIRVTDLTGQVITMYQNLEANKYRLETDPLAVGIYFFIIRFADGSTTVQKLCKIH